MQSYVLMVQVDEDDRLITETTWREIGATVAINFAKSKEEIEQIVIDSGDPSVILLNDLGPLHKGTALLMALKSDARFGHIPVVMLGEVTTPEYISDCYRAGVNTYVVKPSTVAETRKKIQMFIEYWASVAEV
jgi:DNA-binding NarL/FixJ family response regulator